MIRKPSRRASSTARSTSAWPTPRPRSASGTSVWSMMMSVGDARIGHLRLVAIDDDGPSSAGGSVLPVRLVRGGAAWWLVAALGHGNQSSVYLRLWPRDLSTGYFSALGSILRCAAAVRSTPS